MKKRPFSLVEVLVSSVLGVFMITALVQMLGFFRVSDAKSELLCEKRLQVMRLKEELGESLALAEGVPIDRGKFPSRSGLLFSFDNGIAMDPNFCGSLLAHLWFNQDTLYLSLYGKKEERHRPLLREIEAIEMAAWNGKEWISSDLIEISKEIQVVKITFRFQGKKEEMITHLLYSDPLEVI